MAAPTYRYIGVDLLTRTVLEDLPLYGVSLTRQISGVGNMTGSYRLGTGEYSDSDLLNASLPGKCALFALRNNLCVWAGPIWTRTYNSLGTVQELTGQTYESVFAKIKMQQRFSKTATDQLQVFKALIDAMQLQASSNFGIDTSQIGTSGVNMDLTVETYENRMFEEPIDDMIKASGSFEYYIDYSFDINTNAIKIWVRTGYPELGLGQTGVNVDYPGTISNYYMPENASQGVVSQTSLGAGEGSSMVAAQWNNATLLNAGYPAWASIDSNNKAVADPVLIQRIAQGLGQANAIPVTTPTYELKVGDEDDAIDFAAWSNFGIPFNAHIQDERYPGGADFRNRMVGWALTPPSSESVESLSILLEGQTLS